MLVQGAMNGCSFSEPNSITNYVWMHPESLWRPTWDAGKMQEEEEEEEEEKVVGSDEILFQVSATSNSCC